MLIANFHSRTQHLDVTEFFTHQLMHNFFKGSIKIYIKIAPTCFGVITIIRERTINHNSKKKKNSVTLVRELTIPTERLPPVGEVSANFCG